MKCNHVDHDLSVPLGLGFQPGGGYTGRRLASSRKYLRPNSEIVVERTVACLNRPSIGNSPAMKVSFGRGRMYRRCAGDKRIPTHRNADFEQWQIIILLTTILMWILTSTQTLLDIGFDAKFRTKNGRIFRAKPCRIVAKTFNSEILRVLSGGLKYGNSQKT